MQQPTIILSSVIQLLPNVYSLGHKIGLTLGKWYVLLWVASNDLSFRSRGSETTTNDTTTCSSSSSSISSISGSSTQEQLELLQQLPRQLYTMIITFPVWYSEWWWNLVQNDPTHVLVETMLLLSILYFIFSRRGMKSYKDQVDVDRLTSQEEDELIVQWIRHERQPLTPLSIPRNSNNSAPPRPSTTTTTAPPDYRPTLVIHHTQGRFLHVEEVLRSATASPPSTTPVASTATTSSEPVGPTQIRKVLNFATLDFLGMSAETLPTSLDTDDDDDEDIVIGEDDAVPTLNVANAPSVSNSSSISNNNNNNVTKATPVVRPPRHPVKAASLEALDRYGCGSCGPRGFYGTIDVHLELEQKLSTFCQTEDCILYSDGASTVTSTVAAFCKRGDIIIVDEAVYEPICTGVQLSRANVKWFAHNDMNDLRRVLVAIQQSDKKRGRKSNAQRRFIVVEGLYKNTGSICPLDELVALKHEFHCRLILDESFSFGTLGPTGRGVTELYQQKIMHDVEITCIALENALGSIGGVTTGTEEVVDHQRLSGSGYAYSASSPPFTASAALAALNLLQTRPDITLQRLNRNRLYFHKQLQLLLHEKLEDLLIVTSDIRSPIILLQVADIPETEYLDEVVFLQEVVRESFIRGVAFVATATGTSAVVSAAPPMNSSTMLVLPDPGTGGFLSDLPSSIRMTVSAVHCLADIDLAIQVLGESVDVVMSRFYDEETTM